MSNQDNKGLIPSCRQVNQNLVKEQIPEVSIVDGNGNKVDRMFKHEYMKLKCLEGYL